MWCSLSATFLRNRIINALRRSSDPAICKAASAIPQNFVFDNPTIQQLTTAILVHLFPTAEVDPDRRRLRQIEELIEKYSADLPQLAATRAAVVMLTGSTGSLGSHILAALLRDEGISKVYTFDRPVPDVTAAQRLHNTFTERGLSVELLASAKVTALTGDLNAHHFGLDEAMYNEVSAYYT